MHDIEESHDTHVQDGGVCRTAGVIADDIMAVLDERELDWSGLLDMDFGDVVHSDAPTPPRTVVIVDSPERAEDLYGRVVAQPGRYRTTYVTGRPLAFPTTEFVASTKHYFAGCAPCHQCLSCGSHCSI